MRLGRLEVRWHPRRPTPTQGRREGDGPPAWPGGPEVIVSDRVRPGTVLIGDRATLEALTRPGATRPTQPVTRTPKPPRPPDGPGGASWPPSPYRCTSADPLHDHTPACLPPRTPHHAACSPTYCLTFALGEAPAPCTRGHLARPGDPVHP